jgi:hypothetical protein
MWKTAPSRMPIPSLCCFSATTGKTLVKAVVAPHSPGLARGPAAPPVCQNPKRVIAVIGDPRLMQKILRHLSAWHHPPARGSPPGASGPYTSKGSVRENVMFLRDACSPR